jgi:hypothetical protein
MGSFLWGYLRRPLSDRMIPSAISRRSVCWKLNVTAYTYVTLYFVFLFRNKISHYREYCPNFVSYSVCIQSVTETCVGKFWAQVTHIKRRKNIHINMCLATFNLWIVLKNTLLTRAAVQYYSVDRNCMWLFGRPVCSAMSAYRQALQRFPVTWLPKLLKEVPLSVNARMWYTQESAPAHFSRAVRDVLNNTYHDRWVGRGGPTAWPPRSAPDLNPLDLYLWRHLDTLVSAAPVDSEQPLHHRTVDVCQTICNYPGILVRMLWTMTRRVDVCVESHGGHFEPLL